jgi:HEAT repeat protein
MRRRTGRAGDLLAPLLVVLLAACPGSRDRLIADLQSPRPLVRANAVKRLSEKVDADDVSLFTQAARDPVAAVRAEAMAALGRSGDPRVVDLLGEALADPDEQVQLAAAASLATIKTDKARTYLTLQYSRRGRSTRVAIVQALKGINVPGAMASVIAAEASSLWARNVTTLTEGALPERVGAAEELGRSGRPDAVNRLVPLLKDPQVVLAAAAARGLGHARDQRAVPALTALLDENYAELRDAACEALGQLRDPAALPKLVAVALEKSSTSAFATAAIVALPRSEETDQALCDLVLQASEAEVVAAGREMRRRGGCRLEPILERLKAPATANAALAAVVALAPGSTELEARVAPLLGSPDPLTRTLAADALAELGDPAAGPALLKAFEAELHALEPLRADWVPGPLPRRYAPGFDPGQPLPADDPAALVHLQTGDRFRRPGAAAAPDGGVAGGLNQAPREIVDDISPDQARGLAALLEALGRVRAEGARERLLPFTEESSSTLRAAAWAGLAALGEDATPGLLELDRGVQSATAQALKGSAGGLRLLLAALGRPGGDRTRLLEALRGTAPPPDAAAPLRALVKEGGAEAGAAALILAEIRDLEAVPAMLALLGDPTALSRREVLLALGRLGDPRAADAVSRDLYSDSAEVRAAAAEALGLLQAGAHLEAVDALRGDYDLRVREVASAAVKRLGPPAAEARP